MLVGWFADSLIASQVFGYCYCAYKVNYYTVGSVIRNGPFPTDLFFDWILLGLLLFVSRVDYIVLSSF